MDPLSDVLSLLKPRSYMFRGLDAGGQWAIRIPEQQGIKCYAVLSGQCTLSVEGVAESILLKQGDCVLLPKGYAVRLGSDPNLLPIDAGAVFPRYPKAILLPLTAAEIATAGEASLNLRVGMQACY